MLYAMLLVIIIVFQCYKVTNVQPRYMLEQ